MSFPELQAQGCIYVGQPFRIPNACKSPRFSNRVGVILHRSGIFSVVCTTGIDMATGRAYSNLYHYRYAFPAAMTTLTATDARKSLFELLRGANERHEIYHIRHRKGDAVLMSEAEYESLIDTLALLSAPGFRETFDQARREAESGDTRSFEEVFGEPQ